MKSSKFWVGVLAVSALFGVAVTYWLGLFVTPPDVIQGQLVRLLYIHPSVAWVAYLAYGVTSVGSILYLWKRTRSLKWDRLAAASAEVGVVFYRPDAYHRFDLGETHVACLVDLGRTVNHDGPSFPTLFGLFGFEEGARTKGQDCGSLGSSRIGRLHRRTYRPPERRLVEDLAPERYGI